MLSIACQIGPSLLSLHGLCAMSRSPPRGSTRTRVEVHAPAATELHDLNGPAVAESSRSDESALQRRSLHRSATERALASAASVSTCACCGMSCDVCLSAICCAMGLFTTFLVLEDALFSRAAIGGVLLSGLGIAAFASISAVEIFIFLCRRGSLYRKARPASSARHLPTSRYRSLRDRAPLARHSCCRFVVALGLGFFFFVLFTGVIRTLSGLHLDDLHPSGCPQYVNFRRHAHAKFLWIIPVVGGMPISDNTTWCAEMLRLEREEGFVLGMHGVRHEWWWDEAGEGQGAKAEFEGLELPVARERIEQGLAVWADAFNGSVPSHFSFPGQWGEIDLVRELRSRYGMRVRTLFDGLIGRVYHCDDTWCDFTCKSWFVDLW